jgi:hypothetical protein
MKLKDFAATQPGYNENKMLALPKQVLKEVNAGLDAGITIAAISRWLKTKGCSIEESSIRRYRDKRVAKKVAKKEIN